MRNPIASNAASTAMNPKTHRLWLLLDVAGFVLFLELYIWWLEDAAPRAWLVFPLWLAASFLLHHDTPKSLGWRADNLWSATLRAAAVFAVLAAALLGIGFALGAPARPPAHLASLRHLWTYFSFCLLQQLALQSLLMNRLLSLIEDRWEAALAAGLIFGVAHWPNPVLVPVTLVGGTLMAWLFSRERNIIPLAAGQSFLGSLVWWAFPLPWHHSMRVGPAYHLFR